MINVPIVVNAWLYVFIILILKNRRFLMEHSMPTI